MITLTVDLNVLRYSSFDDLLGPMPAVGQRISIVEWESMIHGDALVTEIDHDKRLIYFAVDGEMKAP